MDFLKFGLWEQSKTGCNGNTSCEFCYRNKLVIITKESTINIIHRSLLWSIPLVLLKNLKPSTNYCKHKIKQGLKLRKLSWDTGQW